MLISGTLKTLTAGLAAATLAATATPAAAQLFGLQWPQSTPQRGGVTMAHTVAFTPDVAPGRIIVSFSDARLYYVYAPGRAISYPIATPRPGDAWHGNLKITNKKVNPDWVPTAEMRQENPSLPAIVPGGHPRNPLGNRALYLGSSLYRIHGTDAPWSIGRSISRGCIRMFNDDVADLYKRVPVGTQVTITYRSYRGAARQRASRLW